MSKSLAVGFCLYAHTADPLASLDEVVATQHSQLWQSPVLQVLDVQAFPAAASGEEQRHAAAYVYYLALSDTRKCCWCIVPPNSATEAAIHGGSLEVGCLITLVNYVVVAAQGGKNLVVALQAEHSLHPLSLIGEPTISKSIHLSQQSLVHQAQQRASGRVSGNGAAFTSRMLLDFLPDGDAVLVDSSERWSVSGRVLWKSKLRRVFSEQQSAVHPSQRQSDGSERQRFVFDCVLVDANGDAMKLVFWSCRSWFDTVDVGSCVRCADGTVKRDPETHTPLALHFHEKSTLEVISDCIAGAADAAPSQVPFPRSATRCVGSCGDPPMAVASVLQHATVGDVVTCFGVVVSQQSVMQVRTARGNVDKKTLTVRDTTSRQCIDVTLWEDHARLCPAIPLGQVWCFRDVVVRFFGSTKQLSSRHSSELFWLPNGASLHQGGNIVTALAAPPGLSAALPHPHPSPSAASHGRADLPCNGLAGVTFYWSLADTDASELNHVLVKIQRVRLPIFYVACPSCGTQMKGLACLSCSSTATELRFFLRLDVSDGLEMIIGAVGFTVVGETLFGETTADFLKKAASDPLFTQAAIDSIIGLPVLVKLVKTPQGVRHVMDLKHVNLVSACGGIVDAIASYEK